MGLEDVLAPCAV